MAFIVLGVIAVALKLLGVAPVADWSWWLVLAPFVLALAWWQFADATGITRRREMDKLEERKAERRRRHLENMGLDGGRDKNGRRR